MNNGRKNNCHNKFQLIVKIEIENIVKFHSFLCILFMTKRLVTYKADRLHMIVLIILTLRISVIVFILCTY